jgi:hypothetical protein
LIPRDFDYNKVQLKRSVYLASSWTWLLQGWMRQSRLSIKQVQVISINEMFDSIVSIQFYYCLLLLTFKVLLSKDTSLYPSTQLALSLSHSHLLSHSTSSNKAEFELGEVMISSVKMIVRSTPQTHINLTVLMQFLVLSGMPETSGDCGQRSRESAKPEMSKSSNLTLFRLSN